MKSNKIEGTNPMRVLQVIGSMSRGGAQAFIMNIYRNIDRSKIQFDFIVHTKDKCDFDDEITWLGGKIYHCPKYKGKNHFEYLNWWKTFFRQHPEYYIIHGHVRSTATIYLTIAKRYRVVTIAHSHSTSSGKGIKAIVKNVMQYPIRHIANYMFACSKTAGIWLFGNKACRNNKFYIINNSIEAKKFVFNQVIRNEKRKEFNIDDKFVIGHVGRFDPAKNHVGLVDIFKVVHDKKANSVLLLVGDGELRTMIEEKVNKYGLKDSVIFTGVCLDIPDLMQAMDIFVFPSLWEGLGIVTIEAQAAGLHCIVADIVPKEAYVTDLIEPLYLKEIPEIWANKILNYADVDERRNTLENIIEHGYDIHDIAKWLEHFYLKELER